MFVTAGLGIVLVRANRLAGTVRGHGLLGGIILRKMTAILMAMFVALAGVLAAGGPAAAVTGSLSLSVQQASP